MTDLISRLEAAREGSRELDAEPYLVWSNQHRAWWRADSAGYTVHAKSAGLYSRDEALLISFKSRDGWLHDAKCPDEIAVPLHCIPEHLRPALKGRSAP